MRVYPIPVQINCDLVALRKTTDACTAHTRGGDSGWIRTRWPLIVKLLNAGRFLGGRGEVWAGMQLRGGSRLPREPHHTVGTDDSTGRWGCPVHCDKRAGMGSIIHFVPKPGRLRCPSGCHSTVCVHTGVGAGESHRQCASLATPTNCQGGIAESQPTRPGKAALGV